MTKADGTVLARHDYLPYGEEIPANQVGRNSEFGATDGLSQRFTGKERDTESGLDYFGARYYGSALGRFTSPDPAWFFATTPENPQSWNLYSYVLNNPLNAIDPDGNDCVHLNAGGTDVQRDKDGNVTGIDQSTNQSSCESGGGYWVNGTVTRVTLYAGSKDVGLNGQLGDGTLTSSHYTSVTDNPQEVQNANMYLSDLDYSQKWLGPVRTFDPWPTRMFGTHWCGPGGGGFPINALDAACEAHDKCYDNAGLSASNNTGSGSLSLNQAAAASACNAALYNAAQVHPEIKGSTRVKLWLKYGDKLSVLTSGKVHDILAQGTGR